MTSLGVTGKLVLAFVTLLLGAVLVAQVASQGLLVTDKGSKVDEINSIATGRVAGGNINGSVNFTLTGANQIAWKQDDCVLTNFVLSNSSGSALTLNTDYNVDLTKARFNLLNTSTTSGYGSLHNNNTYADYTYCRDDYLNLSWGRTLTNLVAGFFALAVLLVSIGMFYGVAKDTGML
jgi:hypothetical protein